MVEVLFCAVRMISCQNVILFNRDGSLPLNITNKMLIYGEEVRGFYCACVVFENMKK